MAFADAIVNGLLIGSLYALAAVGFSLIFGVTDVINLTHGVILLLGSYITYYTHAIVGIDPVLTIPLAMGVLFVLGYLYQRLLVQRVIGGEALKSLLVTFGVAMIGKNLMNVFFTANQKSIDASTLFFVDIFGRNHSIGGVTIPMAKVFGLIAAVVLVLSMSLLLSRTELGRAIRATALDRNGAALMGVDVPHTYAMTFGIAAAFSASAGSILAVLTPFSPVQEGIYTLQAFVVVVLGGVGTPIGALIGGLVLGLATEFTATYINSGFQQVTMFSLLVLMLLVRPQGLFGDAFEGGEK
ncbi:MAG: branched-chain amino acid ABC transporter permease [Halanaeroarchaeum sp.]